MQLQSNHLKDINSLSIKIYSVELFKLSMTALFWKDLKITRENIDTLYCPNHLGDSHNTFAKTGDRVT